MVEYISDCNGCPECHYCGRKTRKVSVYHCDECGDEYDTSELRRIDGKDICLDCYIEMANSQWEDSERIGE